MLLHLVLKRVEGFSPVPDGDAALLLRFAADRDESAFSALLQQHGPMVWSVCRHLLADDTDAEDAFQATFLALVRSAKRVRKAEAIGAWLHSVAVRIATQAKRSAARRRRREERAAGPEADRPIPEAAWNELLAAVHEEVQNLPEHLRAAFVLCELEGVRQPDAAARLGWKPGTLTGRLTRARQLLVQRLAGRGLAPALAGGGLALGLATASAAVPVPLIDTALSLICAGGTVPPAILNLVKEASPMLAMRSKLAAATLLFAGGLGTVFFPMANAQFSGSSGVQPPLPGPGSGLPPGSGTSGPPRTDSGYAPPASTAKSQWEYKFLVPPQDNAGSLQGLPAYIKQFEELGNAGWEYCGPLPTVKDGNQLVFKRAKPPAPRMGGVTGFGTSPLMPPGGGGSAPPLPSGSGSSAAPGGGAFGGPPPAGGLEAAAPAATQLVTFQLRNAAAADLATVLEKLFPKNLTIAAEPRTNSLILSGNNQMIDEAKALIEKLDTPSTKPPVLKP